MGNRKKRFDFSVGYNLDGIERVANFVFLGVVLAFSFDNNASVDGEGVNGGGTDTVKTS